MTISCTTPFPSLVTSLRVKIHETETRQKKKGEMMTANYLLERYIEKKKLVSWDVSYYVRMRTRIVLGILKVIPPKCSALPFILPNPVCLCMLSF